MRRWAEAASLYDSVAWCFGRGTGRFEICGRRLVAHAAPTPGQRVLDVGVGRGAAAFPAAEAVGSTGRVLGIDVAGEMLRATRDEAAARGFSSVRLARMPAERLALVSAGFDVVLAGFVVFWFAAPAAAFRELRRVLRPGGTFVSSMTYREDDRWSWYAELLRAYDRRYGCLRYSDSGQGNGLNQNPQALENALRAAGFVGIDHRYEKLTLRYDGPEQWWESLFSHGTRRPLEGMSPTVLARFKDDAIDQVTTRFGTGELIEVCPLVVTGARVE